MKKSRNRKSPRPLKIGLAGTTLRSVNSVKALFQNPAFEISWVLTPTPKKVGRKQILTHNPVHDWAIENHLPAILVDKKIDASFKPAIADYPIDILLVVDFGYLIPNWLINAPQIGALNIHPSKLPKWRGSSPGQFCLLYADKTSAVSLIEVVPELDAGPIVAQVEFQVDPNWTSHDYYQHAFNIFLKDFAQICLDYADRKIKPQPQPATSPTPIARRLTKDDAFVDWQTIESGKDWGQTSQLIQTAAKDSGASMVEIIDRACRAFYDWPNLWTIIPTKKGPKRMKIFSLEIVENKIKLNEVQIEGQQTPQRGGVSGLL